MENNKLKYSLKKIQKISHGVLLIVQ